MTTLLTEPCDDVPDFDTPREIDSAYEAHAAELRRLYLGQYNGYVRRYLDRARLLRNDPALIQKWDYSWVIGQRYEWRNILFTYAPIFYDEDRIVLIAAGHLAAHELGRRAELIWQLEASGDASKFPRAGYVYVLGLNKTLSTYKIGVTTNPDQRLRNFDQTKLPFEVFYEVLIPTNDVFGVERGLHKRFSKQRIRGEWFELSPEDVEYIKGLAT